jgi:hypothetical protein
MAQFKAAGPKSVQFKARTLAHSAQNPASKTISTGQKAALTAPAPSAPEKTSTAGVYLKPKT